MKVYVYIAIALIAFLSVWKIQDWRWSSTVASLELSIANERSGALVNSRKLEQALAADRDAVDKAYALTKQLESAKAEAAKNEANKYAQNPAFGQCQLPNAWVRIDTEAATGVPSNSIASGRPDDSPSEFTDADALAVVVDRTLVCRSEIEKLKALQEYVRGVLGK